MSTRLSAASRSVDCTGPTETPRSRRRWTNPTTVTAKASACVSWARLGPASSCIGDQIHQPREVGGPRPLHVFLVLQQGSKRLGERGGGQVVAPQMHQRPRPVNCL